MTLIEKVVSCAIIGILSAIASPTWMGFVSAQELRTTAGSIKSVMDTAKSEATKGKSVCELESYNFPSRYTCTLDEMIVESMPTPSQGGSQLSALHKLAWDKFNATTNYVTVKQSVSGNTTSTAIHKPLDQSALDQAVRQLNIDLSIVQFLELQGLKSEKTVTGKEEPTHRGEGRREDKETKKPKKQKIKYEGCWNKNGTLMYKTSEGWIILNPSTQPANTIVTATGPNCSELPQQ